MRVDCGLAFRDLIKKYILYANLNRIRVIKHALMGRLISSIDWYVAAGGRYAWIIIISN